MNQFEKTYYESADFWEGEALQDPANVERFRITEALIPADTKSLLDAGCGNGVFINNLQKHKPNLRICGLDRSNKALEFVLTDKAVGEITNLPFPNASFDCVTCLEVLEHLSVDDYEKALQEISRVAGKYIIVSVPFNERIEESYTKCPRCSTIFNYELHLQSFTEEKFVSMFDNYGFKNISSRKLNPQVRYKWHYEYRKLFYPEQLLAWHSPICPICGYAEIQTGSTSDKSQHTRKPRKLISYLSQLPKVFWPKEERFYWILGLFQKHDNS
jgi:ubiquinone/menaquinone biosynthesis C-methylase UbiE